MRDQDRMEGQMTSVYATRREQVPKDLVGVQDKNDYRRIQRRLSGVEGVAWNDTMTGAGSR